MSDGLRGAHDGQGNRQRAQTNGRRGGRRGQGNGAPTVPAAEFTSYYNLPVINKPVWASPDIPVYLFLGGLAGAASLLGAGAQATGRSALGRVSKAGAFSAGVLSLVGLVHDLGRPSRFLNMLQVFKVTSPMSVGSWILAGYVPLAGVAAASSLFGKAPRIGMEATAGSALLGPAVASYTAALTSDTRRCRSCSSAPVPRPRPVWACSPRRSARTDPHGRCRCSVSAPNWLPSNGWSAASG